jgi:5-methylcytosine-specific restriction endonuclease McrA
MTKRNPYSSAEYKRNRKIVLEQSQYTCHYCNGVATTADHIVPISSGIEDHSLSNLLPCCITCNSTRKNKTLVRLPYWNKRYGLGNV